MNEHRSTKIHKYYLSLGSNIEPEANLPAAIELLQNDCRLVALSSIWETPAVGAAGPRFLNAVALVETPNSIKNLKCDVLRPIEARLGRVRTRNPNEPRPIDLDILLYDGRVMDKEIWEYAHLALPLSELLPDLTNPRTDQTLQLIANELARTKPLKRRDDVQIPAFLA